MESVNEFILIFANAINTLSANVSSNPNFLFEFVFNLIPSVLNSFLSLMSIFMVYLLIAFATIVPVFHYRKKDHNLLFVPMFNLGAITVILVAIPAIINVLLSAIEKTMLAQNYSPELMAQYQKITFNFNTISLDTVTQILMGVQLFTLVVHFVKIKTQTKAEKKSGEPVIGRNSKASLVSPEYVDAFSHSAHLSVQAVKPLMILAFMTVTSITLCSAVLMNYLK